MMRSSNILVAALQRFEGLRLKAYKPVPTEKYFTIGYGHFGADVSKNMEITENQAVTMLIDDLRKYETAVEKLVKVDISQGSFDALVDFAYNLGVGNLEKSTLLRKLNAGSPLSEVAREFPKWNRAGGKVLAGLTRRREWEAKRFLE